MIEINKTLPLPDLTYDQIKNPNQNLVRLRPVNAPELIEQRAAKIASKTYIEPTRYKRTAEKVIEKTSNRTKELVAKNTLDAVEVVQSSKLGYAAVAAGAAAGVIYMGNRRRSKSLQG